MVTMSAKVFVDTNVLLRARSKTAQLHQQANQLVSEQRQAGAELWVSRQILREYAMQVTRPQTDMKLLSAVELEIELEAIQTFFRVADETAAVTKQWIALLKQFPTGGKQVHDANIVATMLVNNIGTLLTNNISDMKRFESLITIIPLA